MIEVQGLFETRLSVRDLGRSIRFYHHILGLQPALRLPRRDAAFFWLGEVGQTMLALWPMPTASAFIRRHLTLRVTRAQIEAAIPSLRAAGLTPCIGTTPIEEPAVLPWMPAASVSVTDPDGHSLEYLCMLDDAPQPQRDPLPLSAWQALQTARGQR